MFLSRLLLLLIFFAQFWFPPAEKDTFPGGIRVESRQFGNRTISFKKSVEGSGKDFSPKENLYILELIANPAEGGSVDGSGQYQPGIQISISAVSNEGYSFENWTINEQVLSEESEYQFEMPNNDVRLQANFFAQYFINAEGNPIIGGNVEGSGYYSPGEWVTLTALPFDCFSFQNWTEDGEEVCDSVVYLFSADDHRNLKANFNLKNYVISAFAGEGGGILPNGDCGVPCGGGQSFIINPVEGFFIRDVLVDGVSQGAKENYEFSDVSQNHLIEAFFTPSIDGPTEVCPKAWSYYELDPSFQYEFSSVKWTLSEGGQIFGKDDQERATIHWGNAPGSFELVLEIITERGLESFPIYVEVAGNSPPEAVIVRKGENILLVDHTSGPFFDSFQWGITQAETFIDSILVGETFQFCWFDEINTQSGYYWVETTQEDNECKIRSFYNQPTSDGSALFLGHTTRASIFPNPVRDGVANLLLSDGFLDNISIEIISSKGLILEEFRFDRVELVMPLRLDLENIPPGFYLVLIRSEKNQITKKILIQ